MKKEDRELVLKDLSMRLPYGVKVQIIKNNQLGTYILYPSDIDSFVHNFSDIKPYLRSLSRMTEEEKDEYEMFRSFEQLLEFYLRRHLDFRGIISKGLALQAPEGMYNEIKEEKK